MQKLFTTILLILTLTSYGQRGRFNPFKLIVIKPDTAIVDKSFNGSIDSVQSEYIKRYYSFVRKMEQLTNLKNPPGDSPFKGKQEKLKADLVAAKSAESEILTFRYYQTLSKYSAEVYNLYFNEYEPFSTIIELPNQKTDIASLKNLVDTSNADYVVFFSEIHTEIKGGLPVLKLTTTLYSKRDNKIILTKQTEGDTNSRGDMWTCGSTALSCLLINGVRTSTAEVAPAIARAQMRY